MKAWPCVLLLLGCDAAADLDRLGPETASITVQTVRRYSVNNFGAPHFKIIVEGHDVPCLETGEVFGGTWAGVYLDVLSPGRVEPNGRCTKAELGVAREAVAGLDAQLVISDEHGKIDATFAWTVLQSGTTVPIAPAWELERGGEVTFRWSENLYDANLEPKLCLMSGGDLWEHCPTGTVDGRDITFSLAGVPASLDGAGYGWLSGLGVRHPAAVVCNAASCTAEIEQEVTYPTVVRPLTSPPEN